MSREDGVNPTGGPCQGGCAQCLVWTLTCNVYIGGNEGEGFHCFCCGGRCNDELSCYCCVFCCPCYWLCGSWADCIRGCFGLDYYKENLPPGKES
ncbi:hypothetical protein QOT17_006436 [Balamuthia mandrillaris]